MAAVSSSTDAVLAAIDGAVQDWERGPDAARWHPGGAPDRLAGLHPATVTEAQIATMSAMVASLGRSMQVYANALAVAMAEAFKPLASLTADLAHAQDVSERPRWHRSHCRRCNPAGNPAGDPVGRGYHRRQMARRRRRR